ncbi:MULTISPECIES: hypothetical protein [Nostoc]|uniref:Uncharacterized protein n=1 Tax=Nostoc paludosum FACHB-159 TaxID=2692908 RepID=A0ABR8K879_9NOSO|nr:MULTISPECIES: hypothetical protein [Nostoc]MBD2735680.1 hypothetical protein [Nostoc paludosum FACHB-159]
MGHWALGMGHWALGIGHGALGNRQRFSGFVVKDSSLRSILRIGNRAARDGIENS